MPTLRAKIIALTVAAVAVLTLSGCSTDEPNREQVEVAKTYQLAVNGALHEDISRVTEAERVLETDLDDPEVTDQILEEHLKYIHMSVAPSLWDYVDVESDTLTREAQKTIQGLQIIKQIAGNTFVQVFVDASYVKLEKGQAVIDPSGVTVMVDDIGKTHILNLEEDLGGSNIEFHKVGTRWKLDNVNSLQSLILH